MDIIQKIIENKHKLAAIKIDGYVYDVKYIQLNSPDNVMIVSKEVDTSDSVLTYEFTVQDLINAKEVKLYEYKEIK